MKRREGRVTGYDAFISYNHAGGHELWASRAAKTFYPASTGEWRGGASGADAWGLERRHWHEDDDLVVMSLYPSDAEQSCRAIEAMWNSIVNGFPGGTYIDNIRVTVAQLARFPLFKALGAIPEEAEQRACFCAWLQFTTTGDLVFIPQIRFPNAPELRGAWFELPDPGDGTEPPEAARSLYDQALEYLVPESVEPEVPWLNQRVARYLAQNPPEEADQLYRLAVARLESSK